MKTSGNARNYLTIQNIRYKNKFTYDLQVDEKTLDFATIKLIIQPLIENSCLTEKTKLRTKELKEYLKEENR